MSAERETNASEWTIGRLLKWTSDYLARHQVEDARLASEVLLAHAAGCRRINLYTRFDEVLDEARLSRFREWVRRAARREPIAYLVEEKEFFSLPFRVTRDVLIPRPETELLVECVIDHCTKAGLTHPHLLDLGTGSGCIAVTLLVQLKGASAVATDVSSAALEVAGSNAERHGVLDRLTLVEADRLAVPRDVVPDGGFDVVVSNPPYVAADAMDGLDMTVRDYEPSIALSDGQDGLTFYRSMATDAPGLLAPKGVVVVEVGDGQAAAAVEIIETAGGLAHRRTRRDRVVGAQRVLMFSRASGA
ncbi:MAG: peptide chain release factor N(5)-glutamine methyltransferase [Phycisphaerae bacterium]